MSLLGWVSTRRTRVRRATRALARDASTANYVALAKETAALGDPERVLQVCREGLELHPSSAELQRLAREATGQYQMRRMATLQSELSAAPRAALYRELCEILLERGEAQSALETAQRWKSQTDEPEATYYVGAAHAEFFFDGRRSRDGKLAFDAAAEAAKTLLRDKRPLRLQFEIARRCGAWEDARRALARLLELMPGNPLLEARFRRVLSNCAHSKPLAKALTEVEKTGRFVDDEPEESGTFDREALRPMLKELASHEDAHIAFFLRGNTALVQGAHGPTADRTARAVREVLQVSRSSARRMALGRPSEIRAEGSFGTLVLRPGPLGTAALWSAKSPRGDMELLLDRLNGEAAGDGTEVAA